MPFCLLCQAFQAQGIVKYEWKSSIKPIVQKLMDNEINIIQLPCPESSFNGFSKSLVRDTMGLKGYDTEEYRNHCRDICNEIIEMIKSILDNGYTISIILGIEKSPSCAVSYIYTNKGMQNRKGVFFTILEEILLENNVVIPFIGVNRKNPKKALQKLDDIFN